MDPVQVSVNVSERQFVKGDLQGDVLDALDAYGVPAELLELELTESLLMNNTDSTITLLRNLKAAGVQISIDDFGTGSTAASSATSLTTQTTPQSPWRSSRWAIAWIWWSSPKAWKQKPSWRTYDVTNVIRCRATTSAGRCQ